jgi:5-oxoprolinase (ATP-hydrolysing) subunit A
VTARRTIDLNADMGEATEAEGIAVERALLDVVTTAHVACGGHAGDAASMRDTVTAALAHDVRVGAHPSYPDRAGFGRRAMDMDQADLTATLQQQIGALREVCHALGTDVSSVKAHGTLYGEVAQGGAACDAFLHAVDATCGRRVPVVVRAGSAAVAVARQAGYHAWEEGFCDRAYAGTGALVDRSLDGALLRDLTEVARQASGLVREGRVHTMDGTDVAMRVDTLCIHGDSPGAVAMANAVRCAMDGSGIEIIAPPLPS